MDLGVGQAAVAEFRVFCSTHGTVVILPGPTRTTFELSSNGHASAAS
jgi:hypothetical protein